MYKIDRNKIKIIQVDLLEFNVSMYNIDIKLIDWNDIGRAVSYFLMGSEQLSVDGKELRLWR